jgi:hemin uptake protein HemP
MSKASYPRNGLRTGPAAGARVEGAVVELTSETLLAGQKEVFIRHGSEQYRLRRTRMNKLILTK